MFGIFVLNFVKGYVPFQNKSRHYSSTTSQIQKTKAQNLAKESKARWIVKKSTGLFWWDLCTMPVFWKSGFCVYLLNIPGVSEKLEPIGSLSRGYHQFVRMFSQICIVANLEMNSCSYIYLTFEIMLVY